MIRTSPFFPRVVVAMVLALVSVPSIATVSGARPAAAAIAPGLVRYTHQISLPANALSRSPESAFAMHARGLDWLGADGTVTFTLRKPKEYAGGRVRVTYAYQVVSDESGTLGFHVTPMTFNSGNSFETYGARATATRVAPENTSTLLTSSATILPGDGWGDGAWWYIEAQRLGGEQGGFPGRLRLMSVSIEY